MDIEVAPLAGGRIGYGECVLCQRCVQACTRGALRLTFGFLRTPTAREVTRIAARGSGSRVGVRAEWL
jgi:ferredoxin